MKTKTINIRRTLIVATAAFALCGPAIAPAVAQGILCAGRDYLAVYPTPDDAVAVSIAGSVAYVLDQKAGLLTLDISDPNGVPILLGGLVLPGEPQEMAVEQNVAYITTYPDGLQIVDVSDPAAPALLASYPEGTSTLAVSGGVSCVGIHHGIEYAIELIDVTDPAAPKFLSQYPDVIPNDLVATGGRLYASEGDGDVHIIDITHPAEPALLGTLKDSGEGPIAVAGSLLYLISDPGFQIIDVSKPAAPVLLGVCAFFGSPAHIELSGGAAYVATTVNSLQIIDVSNPAAPAWLGSYANLRAWVFASAVIGDRAYVAHSDGLSIIDVSDPKRTLLAQYETPGFPDDVVFSGNTAFIADGSAGLRMLDLSNPEDPTPLGAFDVGSGASALALEGSTVYLGDWEDGLFIVDVSDPAHPKALSQIPELSTVSAVAVSGGIVYVAPATSPQHPNGLWIFDATSPTSPALLGKIEYNWNYDQRLRAISITGHYACTIIDGWFNVVDVSDPASPVTVGSYNIPDPQGLEVVGDVAYVAFYSGMLMLDISDPHHPSPVTDYFPGGPAKDIAVADGLVYWSASWLSGLRIVDVTDPLAPVFLGDFQTGWQAGAVAVSDGIACVASAYYEVPKDLVVVDTRDCPPCPADVNGDGALDLFDFLAFTNFFASGDLRADTDHNGVLDLFDFLAFANAFNAGCA